MTGWRGPLALAERSVDVESESQEALDAIAPALGHLIADPPRPGTAADGKTQRLVVCEAEASERYAGTHGFFRLAGGGATRVQQHPFVVESFEPDAGCRLLASSAALESGDLRANPAGFALAAWLSSATVQVLHAGAVAFDGRGVLLVGPSGAGKSTSALACALAGADYLADELCLVESVADPRAAPKMHCIYATAKLKEDSARHLGALSWPALGTTLNGKAAVALPERIRTVRSAMIVAIVVLDRARRTPFRTEMIRPRDAIAALSHTVYGALHPANWLSTVTRLVKKVPTYRMAPDQDFAHLTQEVRNISAGRN